MEIDTREKNKGRGREGQMEGWGRNERKCRVWPEADRPPRLRKVRIQSAHLQETLLYICFAFNFVSLKKKMAPYSQTVQTSSLTNLGSPLYWDKAMNKTRIMELWGLSPGKCLGQSSVAKIIALVPWRLPAGASHSSQRRQNVARWLNHHHCRTPSEKPSSLTGGWQVLQSEVRQQEEELFLLRMEYPDHDCSVLGRPEALPK